MPDSSLLRVGVVGAGENTRKFHIPGLQKQPGVEVVAVANRSRESAQRAASEFGIPRVADHWRAIVEDGGIDAVCIGTWPYLHAPITIAALEAGKHVLCEARMAMNASEGRAMLDAARANPQLVAQIVPAPHTLALDRTIIEMIGDGYIGDLIAVDALITPDSDFPAWNSPIHWRYRREYCGNNVMMMGIWYEAMLRWLGPATTVTALAQCVVRHRSDEQGRRVAMEIPDHVDVLCRMAQGGHLRCSVSAVIGLAPGTSVTIYGTDGTLKVAGVDTGGSPFGLWGGRRRNRRLRRIRIPAETMGGWRVEEEFVNAIRGVEPVTHTDPATAVKYMEWTDAVSRSARTGETVHLPLLD